MKIHAKAPNRIDLCGGTLDIYPLYVFLGGGYTINAAIDRYSEVTVTTRADQQFVFCSQDLDLTYEMEADALYQPGYEDSVFRLLIEIVRFYQPETGLTIATRNNVPKGSGLGASSALLIALSGALNHLKRTFWDGETLIRYGADIEARSLDVPTGKQDYYPALYGGINALHFDIAGIQRIPLPLAPAQLAEFNQHLLVTFTGESHFSGTNNWNMLKGFIENTGQTRVNLQRIQKTAERMKTVFEDFNIQTLAELLQEEWHNRKALAEGVTTPQIERMMKAATEAGAWAHKICGAGGGGCMLTLCPPEQREQVCAALTALDATVLPTQIDTHGLQLQVEAAHE